MRLLTAASPGVFSRFFSTGERSTASKSSQSVPVYCALHTAAAVLERSAELAAHHVAGNAPERAVISAVILVFVKLYLPCVFHVLALGEICGTAAARRIEIVDDRKVFLQKLQIRVETFVAVKPLSATTAVLASCPSKGISLMRPLAAFCDAVRSVRLLLKRSRVLSWQHSAPPLFLRKTPLNRDHRARRIHSNRRR